MDQIAPSSPLSLHSECCDFDWGGRGKVSWKDFGHNVFKPLTDVFSQILSSELNSHFEQIKSYVELPKKRRERESKNNDAAESDYPSCVHIQYKRINRISAGVLGDYGLGVMTFWRKHSSYRHLLRHEQQQSFSGVKHWFGVTSNTAVPHY